MQIVKRSDIYNFFHDNARELLDSYLQPDGQNKGYICPLCGNGSGSDGDGIRANPNAKSKGFYHCFVCGFNGDIINLIAEEYGIKDNEEALKKACEIFDIALENDLKSSAVEDFKGINQAPATPEKKIKLDSQNKPKMDDREAKINGAITLQDKSQKAFISQSMANIGNPIAMDYLLKERGLSLEAIKAFNLGYAENIEVGGIFYKSCIVFPTSYASYAVRDTNPNALKEYKTRKPAGAVDIPLGLIQVIKERDKTYNNGRYLEPVFIVEGLLDAPSIFDAGGDAIALNGTGTIKPIIQAFKIYNIKRPLILALDNDTAGRKAQEDNFKKLTEAGLEVYQAQLIPKNAPYKDANDFLKADKDRLTKAIEKAKKEPILEFEAGLNKSKRELFKNGIAESVNAPAVATGFKTLDSRYFLDGGLYEGLYIFGAISSLGKTSFMLQLADQIATGGHDVLYFSLEMSASELMAKSISRYTAKELIEAGDNLTYKARTVREITDGKRYINYSEPEKEYIDHSIDRYFNDTGETMRIIEGLGNIDADYIRAIVDKHIRYTNKPPVVFIDYLQLLIQPKDENGKRHSMTDKQIVDANVLKLKQLSRDYKIPVFAISSFNRDNYNNEVSMLSFKESGAIEYSSDVLLGMERVDQTEKKEERIKAREQLERETGIRHLRLKVLKNRNGQQGGKLLLDFYYKHNYFKDAGDERVGEVFSSIEIDKDFTEINL